MSKTKGRRAQRRFMTPKPVDVPVFDVSDRELLKEIKQIAAINGMGHQFKRRHEDRHRNYGSRGTF